MTSEEPARTRNLFRETAVIVLVAAAVALLTAANLLFWFGNTMVKPDRFTAATAPLVKDPAIQNSLALYTTNAIFNNVNVQQNVERVLPPKADFLAPQLTSQLKSFTKSALQKRLAAPKFQTRWNQVLSNQHARLVSFAAKYQGNGDINLNDIYKNLSASLAGGKLAFLADKQLPPKLGDITLISAPWLPAFHNLVVHIDTWRLLAVVLLVITVAAAAWLSRGRRRTIYFFSLAAAAFMLATLAALYLLKHVIIGKVDPQYAEGVSSAIGIVFHSLVIQTATILAASLFIWTMAWVSGPSRRSAAIQGWVERAFSGSLHQRIFARENRYTGWFRKNHLRLDWAVVAALTVILLLIRLTPLSLFIYIILMILAILIVETIGGQRRPV